MCRLIRGHRQREGSRQNSEGVPAGFSPAFRAGCVGVANLASAGLAGAMLLDRLGPPGRCSGGWPHERSPASLGLLIFVPRVTLLHPPHARADGQAVCRLIRGHRQREGSRQNSEGVPAGFSPAFRAGCVGVANLASAGLAGAMLLDRLGPPGRCSGGWPHERSPASLGLLIFVPRVTLLHPPHARADGQAVCRLIRGHRQREGSRQNSEGVPAGFSPAFRAGCVGVANLASAGFSRRDAARSARAAGAVQRRLAA